LPTTTVPCTILETVGGPRDRCGACCVPPLTLSERVTNMQLPNACFISYRHTVSPVARQVAEEFRAALAYQLELYVPGAIVYFDTDRLHGGDFFTEELAGQLCRSSCMVMLFCPGYFDLEYTYCAREYRAMIDLEAHRLALARSEFRAKGLIIPVVLRGAESLPDEISLHRHYVSLDKDLLMPKDLRHKNCMVKVREIADIVHRRHKALGQIDDDLLRPCDAFRFPSEDDIRPWLEEIVRAGPVRPQPVV
jgi:hypothetical protein